VGFTPSSTHNPPGWFLRLMPGGSEVLTFWENLGVRTQPASTRRG
jgi:hypothetical protein